MGKRPDQPPPETFEEAAKRLREEGEAVPFDEVLRRLIKAPSKLAKPPAKRRKKEDRGQ